MTRWPTKNFRPNPVYAEAGEDAADEAGVSFNVLVQAMLRELRADPAGRLAALAPHIQAVAAETPSRGRPARESPGRSPGG
ncbi:hypothetical protein O7626_05545 [Micromonospora sp. WMMD1102]|uniref:hypothetical protein n=1 Tax=Micromonospora sp. WMMD1102 TaxID=3016105 RepID=UPI002415652F|nr:hypothetical protein [Micromonospora sp. WMMD1102]MDG4785401.1 hypothetical protein [Micromonospora sp. WMMD1102]